MCEALRDLMKEELDEALRIPSTDWNKYASRL